MAAIDLIVLGMIKEHPQSAYELQKSVEYRNISRWVKISTPSIYKKVVQLEQKGYISGRTIKEGNMPEKSIYSITESGEAYFNKLMEKTSRESVSIFLNFNAVVMNLNFVTEEERIRLLSNIADGIEDLKETIGKNQQKPQEIPLTGRTILKQQARLAEVLEQWVLEFTKEYTEDEKGR